MTNPGDWIPEVGDRVRIVEGIWDVEGIVTASGPPYESVKVHIDRNAYPNLSSYTDQFNIENVFLIVSYKDLLRRTATEPTDWEYLRKSAELLGKSKFNESAEECDKLADILENRAKSKTLTLLEAAERMLEFSQDTHMSIRGDSAREVLAAVILREKNALS